MAKYKVEVLTNDGWEEGSSLYCTRAKDAKDMAEEIYKGKEIRIVHPRSTCRNCGYSWAYRGNRTLNATCPNCFRPVRLTSRF